MERVSTTSLQELANMLHEESSLSIRNQLSAWIESKNTNHEHTNFSALMSIAQSSSIKGKIQEWLNRVLNPDKKVPVRDFIPDIPAQMEESESEKFNKESEVVPMTKQDEKEIEELYNNDAIFENTETLPVGNTIEVVAEEKPKKSHKKKED